MSNQETSPLSGDYPDEMTDQPPTDNIFDQLGNNEATIFETRQSLKTTYTPNKIRHRDERQEEIAKILRPILLPNDDIVTDVLILEGSNGTGKTLISETVTEDLQKVADRENIDLAVFKTDCSNLTTQYRVAIQTTNNILLERGLPTISETGYDEPTVIKMLFDQLNELSADEVVLIFDDITRVRQINDILYQVSRAEQSGTILDGTNVTIICTANDLRFYSKLRKDVASSVVSKRIDFPPYDGVELEDILADRADEAFIPGGITQSEIGLTASLAAKKNGDARYGLQILLKAGELAEEQGVERVTDDIVRAAKREQDISNVRSILTEHKDRTQLVLASVAHYALVKDKWPTVAEVTRTHKSWSEEFNFSSYASNMVYKRVDLFNDKELLYKDTSQEGNSKKCVLLYPPERILEACSANIREAFIKGEKSGITEQDLEGETRPDEIGHVRL